MRTQLTILGRFCCIRHYSNGAINGLTHSSAPKVMTSHENINAFCSTEKKNNTQTFSEMMTVNSIIGG